MIPKTWFVRDIDSVHMELFNVPYWLYVILKKIFPTAHAVSNWYERMAENAIINKRFELAKSFIEKAEEQFGPSTFTTRLSIRIERIRILGK